MGDDRDEPLFPGESPEYRRARNELLEAELKLRQQVEQLAAQRRQLPLGGAPPEDYTFKELDDANHEQQVRLSELFGGHDTLIVYSFMYGPKMELPCPACSSMLDALNAQVRHIAPRVSVAVVARSPIARIAQWARVRGWSELRMLSSADNDYNVHYRAENDDGAQLPAVNVFVRRDGEVRHFWAAELLYAKLAGHPRHVDQMWPMWNWLDLTPEGRGDHFPQLSYD